MTALTKCAGLIAGISTIAAIGVAVAQSEPPNPLVRNPAIGAGQQSSFLTPMGETGVLAWRQEISPPTITRQPEVATVAPPAPSPAPEPAPVAAAPEPAPAPQVAMAPPEPAPAPRIDRN